MNVYHLAALLCRVKVATAASKGVPAANLAPAAEAAVPVEFSGVSLAAEHHQANRTEISSAIWAKKRGPLMRRQVAANAGGTRPPPSATHVRLAQEGKVGRVEDSHGIDASSGKLLPIKNATAFGSSTAWVLATRDWRRKLASLPSSLVERMEGSALPNLVTLGGLLLLVIVVAVYASFKYYRSWTRHRRASSIGGPDNFPNRRWGFPTATDKINSDGESSADDSDIQPRAWTAPSTPTTAHSPPPRSLSSARHASSSSPPRSTSAERGHVKTYKDRVKSRSPSRPVESEN